MNSPIMTSKDSPGKRSALISAQGGRVDFRRQSSNAIDSEALAQIFLKNKIDHDDEQVQLRLPKRIDIRDWISANQLENTGHSTL